MREQASDPAQYIAFSRSDKYYVENFFFEIRYNFGLETLLNSMDVETQTRGLRF